MSTWKTIPTVNDATVKNITTDKKRSTNFNSLMTNTPNRTIEELKKHSEELFAAQELENQKLLDAFTNKKLKSKAAIKKALSLSKKHNDAGKKKDKAVNPQVEVTVEGQ